MIGESPAHQLIKYDLFYRMNKQKRVVPQPPQIANVDEEGKTMNGFVMKKAKKKESLNTIGEELI